MKVLVTGANGLLASNLVRELLQSGYEVRGMVRESSNLLSL
jgi:dihydroflavonol-4-reductase